MYTYIYIYIYIYIYVHLRGRLMDGHCQAAGVPEHDSNVRLRHSVDCCYFSCACVFVCFVCMLLIDVCLFAYILLICSGAMPLEERASRPLPFAPATTSVGETKRQCGMY